MKDSDLTYSREKMVVKANELIQKSRFNLSLQQQKIILYLISKIKPEDKEFNLYEFNIIEFCNVCGLNPYGGKTYQEIKDSIKEISDKSLWITKDNEETLLRWIEKPYLNKKNGTIKIRLDEDMKPFLLELKKNFTQYELIWTLRFKSKYSIRLYELLRSFHYHELSLLKKEFLLDDLKRLLGAENYNIYQNFKARVLEPAIFEINSYSDKNVNYEVIKKGKAVYKIVFNVEAKSCLDAIITRCETEKALSLNKN